MDMMSIAAALTSGMKGTLRTRLPLSRRSSSRELLDDADVDASALAANLRDLARLNRLPGGAAASIAAIGALAEGRRRISIVDVGTGAGDLPLAFARHGRRVGGRWRVTAIDNHREVAAYAASETAPVSEVRVMLAEATQLPIEDRAVDIAHASLLLHHLEPDDAVAMLQELRRVARIGVVINDLRRGPLAFALGAPVVLAFGRSRMTRHDGLISLRRAYTLPELDDLLAEAGLEIHWRSAPFMPRVATAAVRRADS